jgi:hypothetical protein
MFVITNEVELKKKQHMNVVWLWQESPIFLVICHPFCIMLLLFEANDLSMRIGVHEPS